MTAPPVTTRTSRAPRPTRRVQRSRHYLMCRPTYFSVTYVINPWMRLDVPVDGDLAIAQWEALRQTFLDLGHRVHLIEPVPDAPDMVFAANGALVVDGTALGARFRYVERSAEAPSYRRWLTDHGVAVGVRQVHSSRAVSEGEGDFLVAGLHILAGTGFRTDPAAHREVAELFNRPVVSLELVDPRFYHLDTALTVLDDDTVAYYPDAFSSTSRRRVETLFAEVVEVGADDAAVLGLNAVSDGRHVVLPVEATTFARQLADRGFTPVPVDLSELRKAGGGPKCCTLEIRR